jgi:hypothetical protein
MSTGSSWIGQLKGSGAEARERAKEDAKQRSNEANRSGSIILSQKDILTGTWDSRKVLFTTLGGQVRPITADDLAVFRKNIKTAQSKLIKGITAKHIIDWSAVGVGYFSPKEGIFKTLRSDLTLAKEQITSAVPVASTNGMVRFITNAGPDSDVTRHHVTIEFLNYGAEAASGLTDARKAALRMRRGPLKIECDCGKWRYWYRYIATIGGYNAGRNETGFPKIRNPKLHGIACKHIVRVAAEIERGGSIMPFLTRMIDKAKSSDDAKANLRTKQKEAERLASNQAKRKPGSAIKTSAEKRQERAARSAMKAATSAPTPKKQKRASKVSVNDAAAILAASGLTLEQITALIQAQSG